MGFSLGEESSSSRWIHECRVEPWKSAVRYAKSDSLQWQHLFVNSRHLVPPLLQPSSGLLGGFHTLERAPSDCGKKTGKRVIWTKTYIPTSGEN
jgi:hypothetical protein